MNTCFSSWIAAMTTDAMATFCTKVRLAQTRSAAALMGTCQYKLSNGFRDNCGGFYLLQKDT